MNKKTLEFDYLKKKLEPKIEVQSDHISGYKILEKIGQGSYGMIYKVINIQNQLYALKIEKQERERSNLLFKEANILSKLQGCKSFPKIVEQSFVDKKYVIMQYLGSNLEQLKKNSYGKLSIKSGCQIAIQSIYALENMHCRGFLHRDLKPENLVVGVQENQHNIYLIDFGLSIQFMTNGLHINFQQDRGMVGTARYTSINSHLGYEQSRRDDLESLMYLIIYLYLLNCLDKYQKPNLKIRNLLKQKLQK